MSDRQIICIAHGKGRRHDFKVFSASGIRFHAQTEGFEDKGFQGTQKRHDNHRTPKRKPRGKPLSAQDKYYNRDLAKRRVVVEHVNRCSPRFR